MAYNIVQRIRNIHQRLSKGHKKIANYVVNNYEQAAFMTATRLGAQVGVSESTVVRLRKASRCDWTNVSKAFSCSNSQSR